QRVRRGDEYYTAGILQAFSSIGSLCRAEKVRPPGTTHSRSRSQPLWKISSTRLQRCVRCERAPSEPFQHPQRRFLRMNHRIDGNNERLFHRKLAGNDSMRNGVGKAHPGELRREGQLNFAAGPLKAPVLLQVIMKAEHELIIR